MDEETVAAAAQVLGLSQLVPDALEDSRVAAYSLLVVAPICALVSQLLTRRGKATTYPQVLLGSFLVPALLIGVPAVCGAVSPRYCFDTKLSSRDAMHVFFVSTAVVQLAARRVERLPLAECEYRCVSTRF